MNELVTQAVKDINTIKDSMLKSGNDIARIIYGIRDELKERNACRDFWFGCRYEQGFDI